MVGGGGGRLGVGVGVGGRSPTNFEHFTHQKSVQIWIAILSEQTHPQAGRQGGERVGRGVDEGCEGHTRPQLRTVRTQIPH